MALSDKLKKARLKANFSQAELAKKLGINVRTYGSYERGERDVSTALLRTICQTLKISSDELLENEIAMNNKIEPNAVILPSENIRLIPVFSSVAAGFGAYADSRVEEYIPLYIVSRDEAENTIAIRVEGNSMYPKIEDGDLIQVLRQDWAENGQVIVALIDSENAVVKKFNLDRENEVLELISFNPEYPPKVFKGAHIEEVKILGVVKKVIKEL